MADNIGSCLMFSPTVGYRIQSSYSIPGSARPTELQEMPGLAWESQGLYKKQFSFREGV